ncbi:fimbrial biogenesis usher protein [Achromobacter xylosoxidans]
MTTLLRAAPSCGLNQPVHSYYGARAPRLRVLLLSALVAAIFSGAALAADNVPSPDAAAFDIEMLKQRGIDPALAEYFREAPRFAQGKRVISLVVNAVDRGRIDAHFNAQGQLCVDENVLAKAGLSVPSKEFQSGANPNGQACYDLKAAHPQATITLLPNREAVHFVVPQEALQVQGLANGNFTRGGTAALFNYDVISLRSRSDYQSDSYLSASTEAGLNMGDWILRSRQLYTKDGEKTNFEHLYTYAQRTLVDQKAVVQAGQININSPLFAGAPIMGMQLLPETALLDSAGNGAVVEGIAQSQATVEVRQAGALIFTTLVPEGPFALANIPLLNTTNDLNVTVRETNGAERHFVVPAASFRTARVTPPGYSFALGKIRSIGDYKQNEMPLATGTGTWRLGEASALTSGAMVASEYQALGWGLDTAVAPETVVSLRNTFSRAKEDGVSGTQASVSVGTRLTENLTLSLSASGQTQGYRDLGDVIVSSEDDWYNTRYKRQYSASVGWSDPTLGSFNLSYSPSRAFDGRSDNRLVGSWGKTFKYATVTASLETTTGGGSGDSGRNDKAFYLNVSIPFGSGSARAYTSRRGDSQRTGMTVSDTVSDSLNYRLSAERSSDEGRSDNYASANLSFRPRYTSIDLGYGQSGANQNWNGRISGGAVAHEGGVTFSPYPVQDTFGVVSVGDISGVKISTPSGPVWTDAFGQAVIPQLTAFRESRVEVQTKSLPRRVDLKNGFQSLEAGRGSVNQLEFDVIRARRMLVKAVDEAGVPLPKGASVVDANKQFVTLVLDNGTIFLQDADPAQTLSVRLPDERSCSLKIDFPKEIDDEAFYDQASGVCRAS